MGAISFEEGIADGVIAQLKSMGHDVAGPITGHRRALFGRGHAITPGAWWRAENSGISEDKSVLWAGADPRADGCAVGY